MRVRKVAAIAGLTAMLLGTGAAGAGASVEAPEAGALAASVDRHVRDYIERTRLPGAVVTVTRNDQVVHTAGYGRTAGGEAITEDTPMPLASLSKSFTALAVLRLADQGRIHLDDPVRKHLPEFAMADPRAERITVRQLLQQTSGMSDRTFPELTLPAPDTLEDAVAMLRTAPLAADPGTRMAYHNPNYAVAARLAEAVAGMPFADHMAAAVFRPLGMASTMTVDTTADLPHAGEGHVRIHDRIIRRSHPKWFVNGSYGVVSTADDLARWLIAQSGAGGVLPEETVRTAQTASGTGGSDYGMGWVTGRTAGGAPRLRHTGWLLTHNSAQTLLPASGYGIAVVTNTGMVSGDDALIITDGLIDLLEGRPDAGAVPLAMTADLWLGGLALLNLVLGSIGVRRARAWARRRAGRAVWRPAVRLIPHALPVVLFLGLADAIGFLMRREGTLDQVSYIWPALYIWAGTGALAATAVIVSRLVHTALARRSTAPAVADGPAAAQAVPSPAG
ncbi:serine hydrolase domain-containing protein [Planomonospora venezuelensis]|uniref:CubicO group peptidase (Beta-lactamase class C family) n=1 Tax=Planomonospora venezuelensis TaxID=1999 RepID=A0A841CU90_PLAVE|nr:serine hydrolase domain-containing protein [Planomonospora venezuelensis]MBB5960879.1 CubicO group peptidase (beta-lactamase class C family) [Planomonospora venezuelensis]GIN01113.1 serine hydrolase [Planomonospora venezuelensis]